MNIYIASLGEHVKKIKEDIYIRDMYISRGFLAEIVDFTMLSNLANSGDVVILKSIWGYHLDSNMFLKTLNDLENRGVCVVNSPNIVRWNINKREYLKEVSSMVPVIPTASLDVEKGDSVTEVNTKIEDICTLFNSEKVVIKPVISASGFLTNIYQTGRDNKSILASLTQNNLKEYIIQPYRDSIKEGEISVIVLRGEILYGVVRMPGLFSEKKSPKIIPLDEVPQKIFEIITALVHFFAEKFKSVPDICRIDFLKHKDTYEILEIELIDPDLYLKHLELDLREEALSVFGEML